MTTELVLLLATYAFVVLGAFLGDMGPLETFRDSGPRLAARIERNIAVGNDFRQTSDGKNINWNSPEGR